MRLDTPIGRGDLLLKYPEFLDDYDPALLPSPPYVAVHLHASHPHKQSPKPNLLRNGLIAAGVYYVEVGNEAQELPPSFRLHLEVVMRARKFIGTLSVFNVVAQIKKVPAFVLVNRSLKEPTIYKRMTDNGSIVREWNNGIQPIADIYREAVEWAKS